MDFCLTCKPEFLHHLVAHRLSINCTVPCDPLEEEHQASKGQYPQHQDQREPSTRTSTRTRESQVPGPAEETRPAPSMQCVRCPAILVLMALVLCSTGVSSQPDRDQFQDPDLELELHNHRLLQRPRTAGFLSQEWSKRAVEDLLAQMSLPEGELQRDAEATGGRMNLERSVDPSNNLPPRERKAGCKNFYWKGLTSC